MSFKEYIFTNYGDSNIMEMWNRFCQTTNYKGNIIYHIEEFMDTFESYFDGEYPKTLNMNDSYLIFNFTSQGQTVISYNDIRELINFNEMEKWLLANPYDDSMKKYIEENMNT